MTERLADISARIEGIEQLGAVVNAMKGIAAARANMARTQVKAVDNYAETIARAMARAIGTEDKPPERQADAGDQRAGLLVFAAEQGFAGAFSERVLDSLGADPGLRRLFLIGTRGQSIAAQRDLEPFWTAAMPSHSQGVPKLADAITRAIYEEVAGGRIDRLDVVFTRWRSGRPALVRKSLFPIDLGDFRAPSGPPPLTQVPRQALIDGLGQDYFHARVCNAALHAFAAENEARMQAMASAGTQIARELEMFQATLRRVRQEAITAEIIELGTGANTAGTAQ
ncbi:F0F1 ATP synthase subunit gamma [Frigidibacter sp. ROC022]|uniref:F0F1 ATP synthase subunit gamma n=1 Tax=Frigidibacter sp. ROC022 TaxID=2971796 RepID=UPI00215B685A|nr:FoF1 ATP synthase subunit gamma [Frigidibacter sp. ROC022]MCR8723800.1 F0F1 ATP synthase subunit gamma [Frigidibacter sp. ROC022]